MMNKLFELIEAKKIFNINYNQISILIHPKSYVHAIIEFNDGMIKIIVMILQWIYLSLILYKKIILIKALLSLIISI